MNKIVNESRVCGRDVEGHGEYQTFWNRYEIKCPECGMWSTDYGEVSIQVGDDPDEQSYICHKCAEMLFGIEVKPIS